MPMIKEIEYSDKLKQEQLALAIRFLNHAVLIFDALGYKLPENFQLEKKEDVR